MKKADYTNPGGIILCIDDLQFVYDALREGLEGYMSALKGYDDVIISGCAITEATGNYTYTEGFIFHNGEIFYVPALTSPTPISLAHYVWDYVIDSVIAEGIQVCEDATIADTWLKSYARIIRSAGSSHEYDSNNNFGLAIKNLLPQGDWQLPTFHHSWAGDLQYRLNLIGEVEFNGSASHASVSGSEIDLFTLPPEYRPIDDKYFKVVGDDGTNKEFFIKVESGGDVKVTFIATGVTVDLLGLHTIRFRNP